MHGRVYLCNFKKAFGTLRTSKYKNWGLLALGTSKSIVSLLQRLLKIIVNYIITHLFYTLFFVKLTFTNFNIFGAKASVFQNTVGLTYCMI